MITKFKLYEEIITHIMSEDIYKIEVKNSEVEMIKKKIFDYCMDHGIKCNFLTEKDGWFTTDIVVVFDGIGVAIMHLKDKFSKLVKSIKNIEHKNI